MAEIIQFPNREKKRERLKYKLDEMITKMDDAYDEMDTLMGKIQDIGDSIGEVEVAYSAVLREYARMTEKESIEARLLTYCKQVDIRYDGDSKTLHFMLEDLSLIHISEPTRLLSIAVGGVGV